MPNELAIIEHQLTAVSPRLSDALGKHMPVKQLIQTVLVSCERTPQLLKCTPQSILNGAMTFAVLGLPVDGVTGQGFLIPFKGVAQAVIGYRGYNTLAARAGLTVTAGTVREGDDFEFELGSAAFVRHRPNLGSRERIIAFWSVATATDRPPVVSVLSIEDVLAIKAKSAAIKAERPTPWNDPEIGFPAMGEKSARRRLSRSTPLRIDVPQFQLAARLEEAFDEQGKLGFITPDRGVVIEGDPAHDALPQRNTDTPTAAELIGKQDTQADDEATGVGSAAGDASNKVTNERALPTDSMIETHLRDQAELGTAALGVAWSNLAHYYGDAGIKMQHRLKAMKDKQLKPIAQAADNRKAQG